MGVSKRSHIAHIVLARQYSALPTECKKVQNISPFLLLQFNFFTNSNLPSPNITEYLFSENVHILHHHPRRATFEPRSPQNVPKHRPVPIGYAGIPHLRCIYIYSHRRWSPSPDGRTIRVLRGHDRGEDYLPWNANALVGLLLWPLVHAPGYSPVRCLPDSRLALHHLRDVHDCMCRLLLRLVNDTCHGRGSTS